MIKIWEVTKMEQLKIVQIDLARQKENLAEFFTLCGSEINKLRRIVLVGAGRIGTLIAEGLLEKKETSLFSKFLHFLSLILQEKKEEKESSQFHHPFHHFSFFFFSQ